MLYLKLPLISPGLVHLREGGLRRRRPYKQRDLSERAFNGKRKSASKQSIAVLIKMHFVITVF